MSKDGSYGFNVVIGITGIDGFLGWHLRCHLLAVQGHFIVGADRKAFESKEILEGFVRRAQVIVHFAGMNRGKEQDIERTNIALTTKIIDACKKTHSKPHILFANSIQLGRHLAYEQSKKRCAELFQEWAILEGGCFTDVILPNVFGEGGRPFYNSVTATFCQQIANGENPKIIDDCMLEIVHAQEVSKVFALSFKNSERSEVRVRGSRISVRNLLSRLDAMAIGYHQGLIPNLTDSLSLELFNTYRSYLFPKHYPVHLELKSDERGSLFEAVKASSKGQCFLSRTKPKITRGNHFHTNKFERFLVVSGQASIRLRKLFTTRIIEFSVSGDEPAYVDIPTFYTHDITNVGSTELLTMFWASDIFDPSNPDTISEPVLI